LRINYDQLPKKLLIQQFMKIPQFVLASASVARRRLLQTVGIEPMVCASDFDESQIQLTEPGELVKTLAQCKAETVVSQFPSALVMGCDSVLAMGGGIYGKPENAEEAIARWQLLQNTNLYLDSRKYFHRPT
jgi:septum formation protein